MHRVTREIMLCQADLSTYFIPDPASGIQKHGIGALSDERGLFLRGQRIGDHCGPQLCCCPKAVVRRASQVRQFGPARPTVCHDCGRGIQNGIEHDLGRAQSGRVGERYRPCSVQGLGVERVCQEAVPAVGPRLRYSGRIGRLHVGDRARDEPTETKIPDHGAARTGRGLRDPFDLAPVPGRHLKHRPLSCHSQPVSSARQAL